MAGDQGRATDQTLRATCIEAGDWYSRPGAAQWPTVAKPCLPL